MRDLNKSYKKIDRLRWHKEKAFIRMVCAFSCAILLIILLLMFPIVSDADEPKISDYYFINDILKLSDAQSHNNENGFYSVPDNIFNSPTFISDDSINYYDQLKNLWDCDFPSGLGNNYNMTVYVSTNNQIKVIFDGQSISLNYDSNYNYLTPPSIYSDSPIVYTFNNNSLVYDSYLDGGSYKNISDCNYILYTTMPINMYYQNADRNLNYLLIENKVGRGQGGFNVAQPIDNSIIDNDYIGENNFLYLNGSSINNFYMIAGIDLNNTQINDLSSGDYTYSLDITLNSTCSLSKGSRNAESQLLADYGLSFPSGSQTAVNLNLSFTNNISDTLTSNIIQIPSSVFNDGLINSNGKTAVPLCNYISSYVDKTGFTDKIDVFNLAVSGQTFGPFSMPTYTRNTNYFKQGNVVYNFVLNIYKNGTALTTIPIATSYNATTGEVDPYSTGGGKSQNDVQQTINQNNENKTPVDPDYKNPDDYKPSITPSNNDNSSNSNSNSSSSSNPTIYNNASITLPKNDTYPSTGVMQSFVRIINNDKNNTVNDLNELVGGNGYIQLVNYALYAVPQNVWNVWIIGLKAILGICVSAFFLKILINWST